ncbi:DUF3347 domain-containing protein [Cytophagaceae bacterium DM2B3-1]|uniref:DUF3347 domain-containing protein n=1 Tax=Xanthocytophaga flava TaxID=3048013 RepID=A0ABT7CYL2_9BACT|nr:DUF3347 domain-containing protein [Xanthocytophaga flavus]MDJ1498869.1 DUF3347 domain-containing protein [Xanthocytophaga flavus]
MKKIFVYVCVLCVGYGSLMSCQPTNDQQKAEESEEMDLPAPTVVKTSLAAPDQFENVLTSYFMLKDSFVKSDTTEINQKATDLIGATNKVDTTKLNTEVQTKWKTSKAMIIRSVTTLQTEKGLEDKRAGFEDLSKIMYEVVNTYGATTTVYKQYCPMALNDKGAYWLSVNKEIKNPYFGDKMLECGEVQEVLTFEK